MTLLTAVLQIKQKNLRKVRCFNRSHQLASSRAGIQNNIVSEAKAMLFKSPLGLESRMYEIFWKHQGDMSREDGGGMTMWRGLCVRIPLIPCPFRVEISGAGILCS